MRILPAYLPFLQCRTMAGGGPRSAMKTVCNLQKPLFFPFFFFAFYWKGRKSQSPSHTVFHSVFLHFAFIFRLFSFSSFFLFVCLTVCVYISDMFAFIRTNNDVIHLFSQQPTSSSSTGSSYTFPRHLRRYCFLFMVIKVTRETIVKSEVKKEEKKKKREDYKGFEKSIL